MSASALRDSSRRPKTRPLSSVWGTRNGLMRSMDMKPMIMRRVIHSASTWKEVRTKLRGVRSTSQISNKNFRRRRRTPLFS